LTIRVRRAVSAWDAASLDEARQLITEAIGHARETGYA
jgi:hypothetical protein